MRSLAFVAVFSLSVFAQAYPAVGDKAIFEGTVTELDGVRKPAEMTLEYTKFNEQTKEWTRKQETKFGDKVEVFEFVSRPEGQATPEAVNDYLVNCQAKNGIPGKLNVPAGEFKTCVVFVGMSAFAIADVPFGYAAMDMSIAGRHTVMRLKSFILGK